jgi:hypothetical protein
MAELIRQRVLRRMDARAGRGDRSPESVATMLRYYLPIGEAHARLGAVN